MAKEEWGTKRVCPTTGKRFYDLNKDPIVSPYTGEEYELSFFTQDKSKTSMTDKADQASVKSASEDDIEGDVDVLDDGDTTDVDVDDELLEEDDDDTVSLDEIADMPDGDGDDS
ncbi:MAG: TIGR02300 family protein [Pseudomonadota bacterium]